jgi:hypothetical protein
MSSAVYYSSATSNNANDVQENVSAVEQQPRITFQSPSVERGGRQQPPLRRQRSSSRDTIASIRNRANSHSGIPIEFQTVAIQVSESQGVNQGFAADEKREAREDDDQHYFEKLNFHSLGVDEICQQFNVSFSQGLTATAAHTVFSAMAKTPSPNAARITFERPWATSLVVSVPFYGLAFSSSSSAGGLG